MGRTSNDFAIDLTRGYFVRVVSVGGTAGFRGREIKAPRQVTGLVVGWNLMAVPFPRGHAAEGLGQVIIGRGHGASQVVRWDEQLGAWSGHLIGRTSNDFAIERGRGYFVRVTGISGTGEFTP